MIDGVMFKELVTHTDERGFFREIIRVSDELFEEGFGQWSHSVVNQNVAKAWHIHETQVDWWYVATGLLRVALYDGREDSSTHGEIMEFLMGDNQMPCVLRIPPKVAHGCKCLSGPTHLFYITSKEYDLAEQGRVPHDDPDIGYDWLRGVEIK